MIPAYPELFQGGGTDYIEKACLIDGVKAWQQCYVCGHAITFKRDGGKWLGIGAGLIRHKTCEPPPFTGGK